MRSVFVVLAMGIGAFTNPRAKQLLCTQRPGVHYLGRSDGRFSLAEHKLE
jgi:hypothetical protein